MKKIAFLITICLLTSACSLYHVHSQDISTDYYPSKEDASQVVYLENIEDPHEIIGYVTINAERRQRISEVLEKMKKEAAILGGDAVTEIKSDATGQWKKLPVQDVIGNGYVRANFTAAVVVLK